VTIQSIDIFRYSIPMHPFTIATGTMHTAQNIVIQIHTNEHLVGWGECSAFPMIVGETQSTCYEMAKDFASLWIGKSALDTAARMQELHWFTARNSTIKSAFDMALYDLAAQHANLPLYQFLGGTEIRNIETDLTIGIDSPEAMATKAIAFVSNGVRILKVKLGKDINTDLARIKAIRDAIGYHIQVRIDANQGWSPEDAEHILDALAPYQIQFCEQPMRVYHDQRLPSLKEKSPIPIMADESVFDHHDAIRLIDANSCHYVNIKFAKSSGIEEALRINQACEERQIPCMMGGMLESRLALSAFTHFAMACPNILFFDLDTCMMGHKLDPVLGGIQYQGYEVKLPDGPGLGARVDPAFLDSLEHIRIQSC
jgi:L-alanine-DL-glutamate epimerase-like enolase superfamily enzyme